MKSLDLVSLEDWYRYKHHIPCSNYQYILVLVYAPLWVYQSQYVDISITSLDLVGDRSVCKILSQYLPLASRVGTRKVIRANTNKPVFAFTLQYAKIGMIVAKFTMLRKTV